MRVPAPARAQILREAESVTLGDRDAAYGPVAASFARAAQAAGALGGDASPIAVVDALIGVKLSRIGHSPSHRDSYVDLAAYVAIRWELVQAGHETRAAGRDDECPSGASLPGARAAAAQSAPSSLLENSTPDAAAPGAFSSRRAPQRSAPLAAAPQEATQSHAGTPPPRKSTDQAPTRATPSGLSNFGLAWSEAEDDVLRAVAAKAPPSASRTATARIAHEQLPDRTVKAIDLRLRKLGLPYRTRSSGPPSTPAPSGLAVEWTEAENAVLREVAATMPVGASRLATARAASPRVMGRTLRAIEHQLSRLQLSGCAPAPAASTTPAPAPAPPIEDRAAPAQPAPQRPAPRPVRIAPVARAPGGTRISRLIADIDALPDDGFLPVDDDELVQALGRGKSLSDLEGSLERPSGDLRARWQRLSAAARGDAEQLTLETQELLVRAISARAADWAAQIDGRTA